MTRSSKGGVAPGRTGVGTWSGGRFMNFGEKVDEDRLAAVLRPGNGISTVITADTYGQGDADRLLGKAIAGVDRDSYSLVGAVGHDFYEGERVGPKGFPRFTDPRLRGPSDYAGYLRMATENVLERLGQDRLDLLLLHNPDHTGYTSETVWDGMSALQEAGLASAIGVAPGPANGFTLDMLDCFDRFGDRIDWAMIILNPLEPWPGEMVLDAAAQAEIGVITRVVDFGGLFWGDVTDIDTFPPHDHRRFRPAGWIEVGNERIEEMRPIADRRGLTPLQLACQWNLAHPAVRCVVPTMIQEASEESKPIEDKRAELAALPEQVLTAEDVAAIRSIGDNHGCMALKGATPAHEGEPVADSWPLNPELVAAGERWGVDPDRDLVMTAGA